MGAAEEAEQVVRDMCAAFAKHDAEALRPFFTDDVVYHNIPMDPAVGIDDTIAFIERLLRHVREPDSSRRSIWRWRGMWC